MIHMTMSGYGNIYRSQKSIGKESNMITLTIKDEKTSKVSIQCFSSMDKAKVEGEKVNLAYPKKELLGVSYDDEDEKAICDRLLKQRDAIKDRRKK